MSRPKVLYIPPQSHTDRVFRPEMFQRMCEQFDVTINPREEQYTAEQVAEEIAGYDGLVTGWGSPGMSDAALENADRLKIIAHSAGSVKFLVTPEQIEKVLLPRDIVIFSANHAIAYNVAETAVGMLISIPRRFADFHHALRSTRQWGYHDIPPSGQFLQGATVGVVAASKVGREVIRMLQPFDCTILLHDPFVSAAQAKEWGVELVELNDLFARSDMVTLHLPSIPSTNHMIGAEQLRLLRDGATLVNTSRGSVLDEAALYEEAKDGRILVALDVTDPEPPKPDNPLLPLPNVYLTPHTSGAGHYGYLMIGKQTVEALEARFAGKPVPNAVPLDKWEILA